MRQIVRRAILSTIGGMTVPSRKALEGCAIEMGKAGPPDDLFFTFFLLNIFLLGGGHRVFFLRDSYRGQHGIIAL